MTYVVNEVFDTFQGEGVYAGQSAFFIRLQGCDQSCPWCDSAGTWHKDWIDRSRLKRISAAELADMASVSKSEIVVITGGEPTLWDLVPLCASLRDAGKRIHLETAGHHDSKAVFDWITVSPKIEAKLPTEHMLNTCNEFKCIITDPADIELNLNTVLSYANIKDKPVWLHPEWSKRNDPEVLSAICKTVAKHRNVRAGYQLHKLYNVDKLDPRADDRLIPLGGK